MPTGDSPSSREEPPTRKQNSDAFGQKGSTRKAAPGSASPPSSSKRRRAKTSRSPESPTTSRKQNSFYGRNAPEFGSPDFARRKPLSPGIVSGRVVAISSQVPGSSTTCTLK